MKVERYGVMYNHVSEYFMEDIKKLSCTLKAADKKIKKIQLFSDFFLPNGDYPFVTESNFYYPLTLIYEKKKWKTHWISWNRSDIRAFSLKHIYGKNSTKEYFSPFMSLYPIEIVSCDEVPDEFCNMISGKKLAFFQDSHHPTPLIDWECYYERKGAVNYNFLYELSSQISTQLNNLSNVALSPKWELVINSDNFFVDHNKKYVLVSLKNSHAECISFWVTWNEDYNLFDYVTEEDVKFLLTDARFNGRGQPINKVIEFIQHGGYIYPQEFNVSLCSDVFVDVQLNRKADDKSKQAILNYIGDYVERWNDAKSSEESEERIHDFFLIESNSEDVISLYIDFGHCQIQTLQNLKEYLDIEKIRKKENLNDIIKVTVSDAPI